MKDFATLITRGIVGIFSIATTAVISVLLQRYLNGMPIVPASSSDSTPQPIPRQIENQPEHQQAESDRPGEADAQADPLIEGSGEPQSEGDSRSKIMKQFWDKLNK